MFRLMSCLAVVLGAVTFTDVGVGSDSVTIGPGDVYQQPSSKLYQKISFKLLDGGIIVEREDGGRTWFLKSGHAISGGVVDTELLLDMPRPGVEISGGVFNGRLEIDRPDLGSVVDISGGVFNERVKIDRFGGDVRIRGGEFNDHLSLTRPSFSDGGQPTVTFSGANWRLNGVPLVFAGDELDLTADSGLLSGALQDGNDFSYSISSNRFHRLTVVNVVPEPSTVVMLTIGALGFLAYTWRRQDRRSA